MTTNGVPDPQAASPWTIRRATPKDIDQIVALWFEGQTHAQENDSSVSIADVRDFYLPFLAPDAERFGVWIAESASDLPQSTILGWQSLLPCRSHPIFRSQWAESSTYVSQTTRVKGVGRALITHVTQSAAHTGLSHIVGYIREGNIAMMKIVEAAGWKRVGNVSCGESPEADRAYYVFTAGNTDAANSPLNSPWSNS
jgi:L-amino acid N-acyltransferase YncA